MKKSHALALAGAWIALVGMCIALADVVTMVAASMVDG